MWTQPQQNEVLKGRVDAQAASVPRTHGNCFPILPPHTEVLSCRGTHTELSRDSSYFN
jgi:hypothetical protein